MKVKVQSSEIIESSFSQSNINEDNKKKIMKMIPKKIIMI